MYSLHIYILHIFHLIYIYIYIYDIDLDCSHEKFKTSLNPCTLNTYLTTRNDDIPKGYVHATIVFNI